MPSIKWWRGDVLQATTTTQGSGQVSVIGSKERSGQGSWFSRLVIRRLERIDAEAPFTCRVRNSRLMPVNVSSVQVHMNCKLLTTVL